jgi:hypothetical protein
MSNFRILRMIATRKSVTRMFLLFAIMFVIHNSNAVAAPANTQKIWRAQIYIVISDIANAETNDKIGVQLNAANNTLLNGDRNYFGRGDTHMWDLRLDGVNQISDLDYLRISKNGSDEMCISLIYLLINNFVIYYERFSDGLWLNNSEGFSNIYVVDDYFMRQGPDWMYYTSPPIPTIIPVSNTRSRLETLVGDFISTTALHWGPIYNDHGVDISVVTTNTWHVDLDLSGCSFSNFLRGDVDVDFDLTISCANAKPNFLVSNVAISAPNSCGTSLNALLNFITNTLRLRLNDMMKNHVYPYPLSPYPVVCPRVTLSPEGNLHFIPQEPTRGRAVEDVAAAEAYSKAPADDSGALLSLQLKTVEEIKPFIDIPLNIRVKSNLAEDTEADMQIHLPAQMAVSDIEVEAQDATGKRRLVAQISADQNGTTLLSWRDKLAAGKEVVYTIQVKFLNRSDEGELEIQTQINAVNDWATVQPLVPLRATTFFQNQAEGVMIQGTIIDTFPKRLTGKEKKKLHQQ